MMELVVRPLGRNTVATVQHWDRLAPEIPRLPHVFGGVIPRNSPNLARFYHRSFPWDQRRRGFCVGFNTTSSIMTLLRIPGSTAADAQPRPVIRLSPLYTYDVARWEARQAGVNLGTGDGAIGSLCVKGLATRGVVEWTDEPADSNLTDSHPNDAEPPAQATRDGAAHLVKEYAIADSFEHALEHWGAGYPPVFCSEIPEGMMNTAPNGAFRLTGGIVGGHCYTGLDYSLDHNWAMIAQSWANWGQTNSAGRYAAAGYTTQVGVCPLDELRQFFTPSLMSNGSSEIYFVNVVDGWAVPPQPDSFVEDFRLPDNFFG